MRKSKFTREEKFNILFERHESEISVEAICARHEISITTFYNWQRELISVTDRDINEHNLQEIKGENRTLRKLYIDLSEHNYQLAQFLSK